MNKLEKMLKKRPALEGAIIGSMFSDIMLLDEFKIKEDLFVRTESKVYFKILRTMLDKKVYDITDADIRLYCDEDIKAKYDEFGGYSIIESLKSKISDDNFESYLDEVQKQNYILSLKREGLDLDTKIEIIVKGRKVVKSYLDIFEPLSAEESIAFMSNRQSELIDYMTSIDVEVAEQEIPEEFLEDCSDGMEAGTPFEVVRIGGRPIRFMPSISKEMLGLAPGTLTLVGAHVNTRQIYIHG